MIIIAVVTIYQRETEKEQQISEQTVAEQEIYQDIRLGIAQYDTINPLISNNKYVQEISRMIYEPLLRITEDYKIENCLAQECSKTSDTTYLIKLKENIKWHDGENFDATDVKFTVDKLKSGEVNSIYVQNVKDISQLEIIDEQTIKITLWKTVPFFEYNLIFPILAEHQFITENFVSSTVNPAGTGMYKISEVTTSGIKLVKNEQYWEPKEFKTQEVKINFYSSVGELYNAFKLGNIDLISTNNINLDQHIGTIGFYKKEYKGREYEMLALNTENKVLQNKEVRQAIGYAIDKTNIVANVFGNEYYTADFPLDYGNWLYNGLTSPQNYQLDLAKQILTENGWENKYGTWQKYIDYYTRRTNFTLIVNSNNSTHVSVAEAIKEQLENLGMRITLRKASESQYRNYLENKNYDMIMIGMNSALNPNMNTFFGENNYAKFKNEEMNTILNEVQNIADENLLKEKYARMAQIYWDEVPYIGLYRNKSTVVCSQNLMGNITPNWYNIFYHINEWSRSK